MFGACKKTGVSMRGLLILAVGLAIIAGTVDLIVMIEGVEARMSSRYASY
jgi:hypothetical protein